MFLTFDSRTCYLIPRVLLVLTVFIGMFKHQHCTARTCTKNAYTNTKYNKVIAENVDHMRTSHVTDMLLQKRRSDKTHNNEVRNVRLIFSLQDFQISQQS